MNGHWQFWLLLIGFILTFGPMCGHPVREDGQNFLAFVHVASIMILLR